MNIQKAKDIIDECLAEMEANQGWNQLSWGILRPYHDQLEKALKELED